MYARNFQITGAARRRQHLVPVLHDGVQSCCRRSSRRALRPEQERGGVLAHPAAGRSAPPGELDGGGDGGPSMNDAMVRIEDVHKRFGQLEVLKGVTFDVARARSSSSWGRAAPARARCCGSSRISTSSTRGRIYVDGQLVGYEERGGQAARARRPRRRRRRRAEVGMVFQRFNLFPHLDALGNVDDRADEGARRRRSGSASSGRRSCCGRSGSATSCTRTRRSSPAASSSASPSRGRWRWTRR